MASHYSLPDPNFLRYLYLVDYLRSINMCPMRSSYATLSFVLKPFDLEFPKSTFHLILLYTSTLRHLTSMLFSKASTVRDASCLLFSIAGHSDGYPSPESPPFSWLTETVMLPRLLDGAPQLSRLDLQLDRLLRHIYHGSPHSRMPYLLVSVLIS